MQPYSQDLLFPLTWNKTLQGAPKPANIWFCSVTNKTLCCARKQGVFLEVNTSLASQAGTFQTGRIRFNHPSSLARPCCVVIKDTALHTWVQISALPLTSCAALGKFPNSLSLGTLICKKGVMTPTSQGCGH